MRILSVDLSFSRTGTSLLDTELKLLTLEKYSVPINTKSFIGIQEAVNQMMALLSPLISKADRVVMEEPFPNSNFSSGLYALDSVFYRECKVPIITYNPTTLAHIHGTRKYSKSDSTKLAQALIKDFYSKYFLVNKERFTHDEAESLIYLTRAIYSKFRLTTDIRRTIDSINPRIGELK